jgi:hypothetical protein
VRTSEEHIGKRKEYLRSRRGVGEEWVGILKEYLRMCGGVRHTPIKVHWTPTGL